MTVFPMEVYMKRNMDSIITLMVLKCEAEDEILRD